MYSLLERLRSLRHGFWFGVSERIRWSRGVFHETPARELSSLARVQEERIAALRSRYQVQFERQMSAATSANNYEYLDILDRAWTATGMAQRSGGVVCDIGSASFWYAATLHAFFLPDRLVGIEIEGHRLFRDGRARIDYAAGYVTNLSNTQYVVADYASYAAPADVITAWFPFLTATAILAWRLPLSLLAPPKLFSRIKSNLNPGGCFVMVNHGLREAAMAEPLCVAAGLQLRARWAESGDLSTQRARPPVVSVWEHSQAVPNAKYS